MKKKNVINKGVVFIAFMTLLVGASTISTVSAVDEDHIIRVPQNCPTIKLALATVVPNSIIIVSPGTYNEHNLIMETPYVSLVSSTGHPSDTIIDGEGNMEDVIRIKAHDCAVSGFTIQNSGTSWDDAGIYIQTLDDVNTNCHVMNNIFRNNTNGVYVSQRDNGQIIGNTFEGNNGKGILLENTHYFHIYHNNFLGDTDHNVYEDQWCSGNSWDNGYPDSYAGGGNYWADYNVPGAQSRRSSFVGIFYWNEPYDIPGDGSGQDRYPFVFQDGWIQHCGPPGKILKFQQAPEDPIIPE